MLTLRTLGTLSILDSEGSNVGAILAQTKRSALFVYLALARPPGLHRRHTILCLFWPDEDECHARGALSQSLYFLRGHLPEGVIVGSGAAEVGIASDRVRADVAEFGAAIAERRWAEALELYGGDFLPGFHVGGAWGFEEWMEGERTRLREMAAGAAWSLADEQIARGQLVAAERTAQRALEWVYTDETPVRRFIESLASAGDRAAALNFYERFREKLWVELELEPSPPTRDVAEAVKNEEIDWAPRSGPTPSATASTTAPPFSDEPPRRASEERSRPRKILIPAVLGALAITLSVVGFSLVARNRVPPVTGDRVVVFPFQNLTGNPDLAFLETAVSKRITAGLSLVDEVGVVAASDADWAYRLREKQVSDAELATSIGANLLVTGSFTSLGGELRFHAEITHLARGAVTSVEARGPAVPEDAMVGVEVLREAIMGVLAYSFRDEHLAEWRKRPPPSYPAALAMYRGDQSFFEGDWQTAARHYLAAYQQDTTFLVALLRTAVAFRNVPDPAREDSVLAILEARREDLAPKDEYWLDNLAAEVRGDLDQVWKLGRFEVERDPGDQEVKFLHGVHALWLGRVEEALEIMEGVDPGNMLVWNWPVSWIWLADANYYLGRYEEALRVSREAIDRLPGMTLVFRRSETRALTALGRLDEIEPILAWLEQSESTWETDPAGQLIRVAADLARDGYREESMRVAERAVAWYTSHDPAPDSLAASLLLAGRSREALDILREVVAETPDDLQAHGLAGVALARLGDREGAEAEARWFGELDRLYLRGQDKLWRAAILAHLGQADEAIQLVSQARQEGQTYLAVVGHAFLEPLWGYEPYERLMAPRG
ncbi:MAG TPA: BTAD domain-containing putative transcriptional regulator [Longimicrobiales bacterium]|nr:BTAD domain-containing putative transcriptional regulator [Longimicrobiales bacterium]